MSPNVNRSKLSRDQTLVNTHLGGRGEADVEIRVGVAEGVAKGKGVTGEDGFGVAQAAVMEMAENG